MNDNSGGAVTAERPDKILNFGMRFGAGLFSNDSPILAQTGDDIPQSGQRESPNKGLSENLQGDESQVFGRSFLFADPEPGKEMAERETSIIKEVDSRAGVTSSACYEAVLSSGMRIKLNRRSVSKRDNGPDRGLQVGERNHYGIPIHKLLLDIGDVGTAEKWDDSKPIVMPEVNANGESCLISEKYRARKWTDLLGPEATHRSIMKWVMAWQNIVFKTGLPPKEDMENRDVFGRPLKKILLIHGPPGIGKTTLAHIVARHGGYDVMEINASDERSGTLVRDKIHGALDSHQISKSRRPVCIVADEVEGAQESGFIRILVDLVKSDTKALQRNQEGGETTDDKDKTKEKGKLIARPIICICNDVWAPALRSLRPLAEIVSYTRSPDAYIVGRLREVCSAENIKMDTRRLTEIVEVCGGDLRSCLNTIQWACQVGDSVYRKDMARTWSKVANRVFRRMDSSQKAVEMAQVLDQIHDCGEYDQLVKACFALYPTMQWADDLVAKPAIIGDWMHFYERLNAGIYERQHGVLSSYLAHPTLAFYSLFSSTSNIRDERVKSDFEVYERARRNIELSKKAFEYAPAEIRKIPRHLVSQEFAPFLLKIISPEVEARAYTLRSMDQSRIAHIASLMINLDMNFQQNKLAGGTFVYQLEKPIEQLCAFGDEESLNDASVGNYSTRQKIVAAMKKIKNESRRSESADADASHKLKKQKVESAKPKTDIWGRAIASENRSRSATPGVAGGSDDNSQRVWVQYVEGFSNAVRKDISWSDLWLI
jgi:chromosome transmission fidelity protein 18